jgi:hypothetical protein
MYQAIVKEKHGMIDYNLGKGVYVWTPGKIERGDPQRILSRLKLAGVQSAAVKICDGIKIIERLEPLIQTLRNNQIRVIGWGYSYLGAIPTREAQCIVNACRKYEIDMYLIDVEHEVEGNYTGARLFMEALRYGLPNVALGLNTFWSVSQHPSFPWAAFLEYVDFVCPQVYWRGQQPIEKLFQSKKGYASLSHVADREVLMPLAAGDMFTERGIKPTAAQVIQFLETIEGDPSMHGVLMWAADDNETTSDLWKAFSSYHWKKGGNPIPAQPTGWAQVKYGMHVRSAPQGDKIRGLVKNDLVPIWSISESKWGAISPKGDEWIYLGNPALVEMTVDVPTLPPLPLGLYRAVVTPGRGLNVRDDVDGKQLRALSRGDTVEVYELKNGWARVNLEQSEWVNAAYLRKTA